jgi:arylsulfatase A-like enzyme
VVAAAGLALFAALHVLCYGILRESGSMLDWGIVALALNHPREVLAIVATEAGGSDALLYSIPMLLPVVVWFTRRRARRLGRVAIRTPDGARILGLAAGLVVAHQLLPAATGHPELSVAMLRPLLPIGSWAMSAPAEGSTADVERTLPSPEELQADWERRSATSPRPNFLVIGMESVRASATTPYAGALDTTPFLARLAARSVVFEHVYSTMPNTSKALVSMLSGHLPEPDAEVREPGRLPAGGVAGRLARIGYRTLFIEPSTEFYERRRLLVESLGFEDYRPGESLGGGFQRTNYFGLEDRAIVGPLIEWLELDRSRPFFAMTINLTTHHPYVTPKGFVRPPFVVDRPPPERRDHARYLACIRYFDGVIEELFGRLESGGFLSNTVVILVGDHGQAFGEHGRMQHAGVLYEEVMHVPLVMIGPEHVIGPPRRVAGIRQICDVAPTLADLVGVPDMRLWRSEFLGVSLLADAVPGRTIHMFTYLGGIQLARLVGDVKAIYYQGVDRLEVYRLGLDPGERVDLSAQWDDGAREAELERMRDAQHRLSGWYALADRAAADRIQRREPPRIAEPIDVRIGSSVRLIGVDCPSSAARDSFVPVTLYFAVAAAPPEGLRLDLRTRQFLRTREARCVLDPNRVAIEDWSPGFIELPLHIHLSRRLVTTGFVDIELGVLREDGGLADVEVASGDVAVRDGRISVAYLRVR